MFLPGFASELRPSEAKGGFFSSTMLPLDLHAKEDLASTWFHSKVPQISQHRSWSFFPSLKWFQSFLALRVDGTWWTEGVPVQVKCAGRAKWGHLLMNQNMSNNQEIWSSVEQQTTMKSKNCLCQNEIAFVLKLELCSVLLCADSQNIFKYITLYLGGINKKDVAGKDMIGCRSSTYSPIIEIGKWTVWMPFILFLCRWLCLIRVFQLQHCYFSKFFVCLQWHFQSFVRQLREAPGHNIVSFKASSVWDVLSDQLLL